LCGIAAIINFNKKLSFQLEEIHNITQELSRRGPDDEGYAIFKNKRKKIFFGTDTPDKVRKAHPQLLDIKNAKKNLSSVALGHRRLSIIDTTPLGHQPMCSNNRYWITYNGEIYNYIELREELKKLGHKFKTKTDTEVILKAYQETHLCNLVVGNVSLNLGNHPLLSVIPIPKEIYHNMANSVYLLDHNRNNTICLVRIELHFDQHPLTYQKALSKDFLILQSLSSTNA
jgi:glutamine phosphoribosylpyrophosphate amidotransferase